MDAVMLVCVSAAAVAAWVMREGLMCIARARCRRGSPLARNSSGLRVRVGVVSWLRPSVVRVVSGVLPWAWRSWVWFWSRRLRSAESLRQVWMETARAAMSRVVVMASAMSAFKRIFFGLFE